MVEIAVEPKRVDGKDIEKILRSVVRRVHYMYSSLEYEELEAEAWLIATEAIPVYDRERGASLSTFLYSRIKVHLKMYAERVLMKQGTLNGHRVAGEYDGVADGDLEDKIDARLQIERLIRSTDGVSRDILIEMSKGSDQVQVAETLGISKQRVSKLLKRVRDEHGNQEE